MLNSGLVGDGGAFAAGSIVVLTGLQSKPELNGRRGEVVGYSKRKGRYKVAVEGREKLLSLKPSNVFIQAAKIDDISTSRDFVIDIQPFMAGASAGPPARWLTAASWDATFRQVGFARIVGHGVSAEAIAELRRAARAFFARPDKEELPYHRPARPGVPNHGTYAPLFSGKTAGIHNDPLEGYTFVRPQSGWTLSLAEQGHPRELALAAERYCRELEEVMLRLKRFI